jgi:plant G-box-binding factor
VCCAHALQTKQQIKRLRRQQSNRESARRSRQRKAEEANMLARRVGEMEVTCNALQAKNATLVAEVQQLRSIIEMMAGDSSALAAQVGAAQPMVMVWQELLFCLLYASAGVI